MAHIVACIWLVPAEHVVQVCNHSRRRGGPIALDATTCMPDQTGGCHATIANAAAPQLCAIARCGHSSHTHVGAQHSPRHHARPQRWVSCCRADELPAKARARARQHGLPACLSAAGMPTPRLAACASHWRACAAAGQPAPSGCARWAHGHNAAPAMRRLCGACHLARAVC